MSVPSAIRYLRECYREDNVRAGYWDLFGREVLRRVIVDGREALADGLLDHITFPRGADAAETEGEAAVRAGEFELLYGLLFVTGRALLPGTEKPRQICAPLFLFPARIETAERGFPAIEIDIDDRRLNLTLLDLLGGDLDLAALVSDELAGERLTEGVVTRVAALLRDRCVGVDIEPMMLYPQLLEKKELRAFAKDVADGSRKLLPAAGLGLWPKSQAVRGVVSELGALAEVGLASLSHPVRALLSDDAPDREKRKVDASPPLVPAVLSGSQEAIVRSARSNVLTFVNGPPGTGKSFTIAAVALDHLARGESVLIAAGSDAAVDVIATKIEAAHGVDGCVVRAGKKQYLRGLKAEVDALLGGERTIRLPAKDDDDPVAQMRELAVHVEKMASAFDARRRREERWGEVLVSEGGGLFGWLRRRIARAKAGRAPAMWGVIQRYEMLLEHSIESARRALVLRRDKDLRECLSRGRHELKRFRKAIGSRRGATKEKLFGETDFAAVLAAFPIWLVKAADISRVLPLCEPMFDVAIIDEATQCDCAGSLPVLQRGKRAVVAGDPKQLRHISFLSRSRQQTLGEKFGIPADAPFADYRSTSLLDLVETNIEEQTQVGFLNEHFRSEPDIIAFSNARFYGGRLSVMTETPHGKRDKEEVLRVYELGGTRGADGVNPAEVDGVIEILKGIVAAGGSDSVGVLSPFRAQVDAVLEAVRTELGAVEFAALTGRHQLRVGTAHAFQGDERDVMVLSFAIDSESPAAARRFLEREDVFNVSITRARREQHLLCSFGVTELAEGSLLRDYIAAALAHEERVRPADGAVGEVSDFLRVSGARVDSRRSVAGVEFDLVAVAGGGRCLAIDLIGFPGRGAKALPLGDYRMFRRAGTRVFPLPYSAWLLRRDECESALLEELGASP